jgi:hypothetical protein
MKKTDFMLNIPLAYGKKEQNLFISLIKAGIKADFPTF